MSSSIRGSHRQPSHNGHAHLHQSQQQQQQQPPPPPHGLPPNTTSSHHHHFQQQHQQHQRLEQQQQQQHHHIHHSQQPSSLPPPSQSHHHPSVPVPTSSSSAHSIHPSQQHQQPPQQPSHPSASSSSSLPPQHHPQPHATFLPPSATSGGRHHPHQQQQQQQQHDPSIAQPSVGIAHSSNGRPGTAGAGVGSVTSSGGGPLAPSSVVAGGGAVAGPIQALAQANESTWLLMGALAFVSLILSLFLFLWIVCEARSKEMHWCGRAKVTRERQASTRGTKRRMSGVKEASSLACVGGDAGGQEEAGWRGEREPRRCGRQKRPSLGVRPIRFPLLGIGPASQPASQLANMR